MLASIVKATAPVASFTVDGKTIVDGHITVSRNETVCFTSTSTDADGDSLKYQWTFGDGGDTSAAPNPCHIYRTAGSYAIKLKVSDRRDSMPLLTGKTPSNYSLPSGWSLVRTQDFETGINADEYNFGAITTTNPHSGTHSSRALVWKDDCATGWKLNQGTATKSELYISWYEYLDRNLKMNDEMFLFYLRKNFETTYIQARWQYLNRTGVWSRLFNLDSADQVLFVEGNAAGMPVPSDFYGGKWMPISQGQWRQWEVYWRPSSGGLQNGETRIYLNGILQQNIVDTAFTGTVDMSGPAIYLGGTTYTKITWYNHDSTCAQDPTQFDLYYNRPKNFKWPTMCQNQSPPNGYVPKAYRYIDDIIILERN